MNNFVKLIISIGICLLAGFIGTIPPSGAENQWFMMLNKPSFNPPNWVFAPVWTTLYILMGIALFLVWREGLKNKNVKSAFITFIVQLIVNASWSIAFFGFESLTGSLAIIIALLLLIILTMQRFFRVSGTAGYLLMPYLAWVSFATVLNFSIRQLNT